jgi:hypothetical protein
MSRQGALPVNGHVPDDGVLVRRDLIFRPDSELEPIGRGRERQRIQGVVVRVPLVELKVADLRLLRIWNVASDERDVRSPRIGSRTGASLWRFVEE